MFFEESPQLIILVFMYYFHCCGWSEVYLRSTIGQQLPKLRLILPKQQTYICEVLQTKRGSIPLRNEPLSLWTSLGLNQGPPDYESVALTNWATSPVYPFIGCGHKSSAFCRIMQILLIKICYSLPSKLIFAFRILGKPAFPYPFFLFKDLFNGPEGRESEYA